MLHWDFISPRISCLRSPESCFDLSLHSDRDIIGCLCLLQCLSVILVLMESTLKLEEELLFLLSMVSNLWHDTNQIPIFELEFSGFRILHLFPLTPYSSRHYIEHLVCAIFLIQFSSTCVTCNLSKRTPDWKSSQTTSGRSKAWFQFRNCRIVWWTKAIFSSSGWFTSQLGKALSYVT